MMTELDHLLLWEKEGFFDHQDLDLTRSVQNEVELVAAGY